MSANKQTSGLGTRFRSIPGISLVHQVNGGVVWATSGRSVRRSENGRDFFHFCSFPLSLPRDLLLYPRILARVSRSDKCNVYETSNKKLIGIRDGEVFNLTSGYPELLHQIRGDCVLACGIAEATDQSLYFGEYFGNKSRGAVRLYRVSSDFESVEIAHEFSAGEIRHVHGVFQDPYDSEAIWVTTGDLPGECYLYVTRDKFKTVEKIGDGSQAWRAVHLHFTPDAICWITDSNLSTNHASRVQRGSDLLQKGQEFDGSAWYGLQTVEGEYIAFTTVEVGPAIRTDECRIFLSNDAFDWRKVGSFQKDSWRPMKLFKFGVINSPAGEQSSRRLIVSGEGLRGIDGKTIELDLHRT